MSGTETPLFFLAFDHRGEFARSVLDAEADALTSGQIAVIRDAKDLIFEATLEILHRDPSSAGHLGILTDEEYGAASALAALDRQIVVAMPVEAPDRPVFDFAYGEDYRAHIERFKPTYAKVLVRYNVDGDHDDNLTQRTRLLELSSWLADQPYKFMFELVVTPTAAQLGAVAVSGGSFDRDLRPALIRRAIEEIQSAGIEPDIWKLEGIDNVDDARAVAEQARYSSHRDHVTCIVLGAAKGDEQVRQWLQVAASVDGYAGFAIGRSIWRAPIREYLAGTIARHAAASTIAKRYLELVRTYTETAQKGTTHDNMSTTETVVR